MCIPVKCDLKCVFVLFARNTIISNSPTFFLIKIPLFGPSVIHAIHRSSLHESNSKSRESDTRAKSLSVQTCYGNQSTSVHPKKLRSFFSFHCTAIISIDLSYVFPHYYSIIQILSDNSSRLSQFNVPAQFTIRGSSIHKALATKASVIVQMCLFAHMVQLHASSVTLFLAI